MEPRFWESDSFDLVTGFSSFQFADDKVRALSEAGRASRDLTAVIIPTPCDLLGHRRGVQAAVAAVPALHLTA